MVGQQQPRHSIEGMYGTSTTIDRIAAQDLASVSDRITRESILDCLLNTPHSLTVDALAARTDASRDAVETHLDALVTAGIVTTTDEDTFATKWEELPFAELDDADDTAEVFHLEAQDKEYREWFGVDDPYDARQPPATDTETAIAALGQWFGVRKRLHQLADDHAQ